MKLLELFISLTRFAFIRKNRFKNGSRYLNLDLAYFSQYDYWVVCKFADANKDEISQGWMIWFLPQQQGFNMKISFISKLHQCDDFLNFPCHFLGAVLLARALYPRLNEKLGAKQIDLLEAVFKQYFAMLFKWLLWLFEMFVFFFLLLKCIYT